ncbi:DeoR/GlpR family DNA-binding transcription regulator [Actinoplanes sp. M2I2]|uniref:DeoR/GlpR family DNA-binding transcription regulator n=1 Tax=Actinoplanes sp. M2I2 TaxID=1734444 RepID=UPI0020229323|nr:DeoR/GlpR family DNA-binding transcription regulator [Actinoplanes sp. M2I2]
MSKHERWSTLLELVSDRKRLSIEDAAQELDVSAATIRRDFDELAQQQMVTRTRGGVVAHTVAYELPLRYKVARNAGEKQRIAAAAAALIEPGATVGLNGGTTTTEVARALATQADLDGPSGGPGFTVVTNALNIANELVVRPHVKVVSTGGVARTQSFELIGPLATDIFRRITIDTAVLGVSGLDAGHGATCHHEGEADINRLLAEQAAQVIVVADGSKLGRHAFARICAVEAIQVVVTDAGAPPEEVTLIEQAGVRVIQA